MHDKGQLRSVEQSHYDKAVTCIFVIVSYVTFEKIIGIVSHNPVIESWLILSPHSALSGAT